MGLAYGPGSAGPLSWRSDGQIRAALDARSLVVLGGQFRPPGQVGHREPGQAEAWESVLVDPRCDQ